MYPSTYITLRTGKYIFTDSGSPGNLTQKQYHKPSVAENPKLTCPSWLFLCWFMCSAKS
jgi:hypothetical protein